MTLPMFEKGTFYNGPTTSLYGFQASALFDLRERVRKGKKSILVVAPTGAGKTVLIAAIIKNSRVPVLFIAHRTELLDQCEEQLSKQGLSSIGIIRANDKRTNPGASVQIASIQTLRRRALPEAGLIIIDEAHLAAGKSYVDVLAQFPRAISLGFTASPCRMDNKPLSEIYEDLLQIANYSTLIEQGYIEAPICYSGGIIPNLQGVKIVNGDYEENQLATVMSENAIVGDQVEHWKRLASDRTTFIFAVNIAHSRIIEQRFRAAGVRIAHLDGDTPEQERKSILKSLANGDLQAVTNCNVLLEGVDIRRAKCVVHARPTRSLVLYIQSVGRILRTWNGVKPILLDHAGNYLRHGPPHADRVWSLSSEPALPSNTEPTKTCPSCYAFINISKDECPYCGHVFSRFGSPPYVEVAGTLQPMGSDAPLSVKREFFDQMLIKARTIGYAPGWPKFRYEEHFKGERCPPLWTEGARNLYIKDAQWVARHEYRKKMRGDTDKERFFSAIGNSSGLSDAENDD